MKSLKASALALFAFSSLMLITNPTKEQYTDYAYDKLNTEIPSAICTGPQLPKFLQSLAQLTADTCKTAIKEGVLITRDDVKNIISNTTKRDNFMFLSIYTTEISDYRVQSVGAFGNFLTFQNGFTKSN